MERLTEVTIEDGVKLYDISEKLCLSRTTQGEKITTILKKLADYEDLEGQGMLIKLPCKVGDVVYAYCNEFGILEYEVDSIVIDKHITYQCSAYSEPIGDCPSECLDEIEPDISDFGKTVFLTKSEAEEKISCNCHHNSNSRDNESCCKCDSKQTNADRIRNMSDDELACVIEKIKMCGGLIRTETTSAECNGCKDGYCCNVMQWLQSEAE